MTRAKTIAAATMLALVAAGCGTDAPSPTTTVPAAEGASITAPIQRANEVAGQLNQREADLEQMVDEMGG